MSKWAIDSPDAIEDVPCPTCAGTGCVVVMEVGLDWCDDCKASGEVTPEHARKIAMGPPE